MVREFFAQFLRDLDAGRLQKNDPNTLPTSPKAATMLKKKVCVAHAGGVHVVFFCARRAEKLEILQNFRKIFE